jgi:hypothetical protein
MTNPCPHTLVTHRFNDPTGPGRLHECTDPDCPALPADHTDRLPCRWSWPHAHGKAHGGRPFPARRCPGCQHIRRAGKPLTQKEAG